MAPVRNIIGRCYQADVYHYESLGSYLNAYQSLKAYRQRGNPDARRSKVRTGHGYHASTRWSHRCLCFDHRVTFFSAFQTMRAHGLIEGSFQPVK